jgi:CRP-like cAMP-binding protein
MTTFIDHVHGLTKQTFKKGETVLAQGEKKKALYFLCEGKVEILKNDTPICMVADRGAVFGEVSVLLNIAQTATVRAIEPSTFFVIREAPKYLQTHSALSLLLGKLLARRLVEADSYLLDIKQKLAALSQHVGDKVPEEILFRQLPAKS